MNEHLERLIALQRLDSARLAAERRLAEDPGRQKTFDARLEEARANVAAAKQRLADNQTARRAIEKDVAMHQGRLSKFREQAMAVKTNQEYQHEIAFAETEIKGLEDKILELMIESDEFTAQVKGAEAELASDTKAIDAERRALATELSGLKESLEGLQRERAALIPGLDPGALATFERVAGRRNGVALAEARDGICTICHVRLRPQVFNTVLRNEQILQCDHCNRILYFVPVKAADAAPSPAP